MLVICQQQHCLLVRFNLSRTSSYHLKPFNQVNTFNWIQIFLQLWWIQCIDTVGWAIGRANLSCKKSRINNHMIFFGGLRSYKDRAYTGVISRKMVNLSSTIIMFNYFMFCIIFVFCALTLSFCASGLKNLTAITSRGFPKRTFLERPMGPWHDPWRNRQIDRECVTDSVLFCLMNLFFKNSKNDIT